MAEKESTCYHDTKMNYITFHKTRLWLQYAYDILRWYCIQKHRKHAGAAFSLGKVSYDYYRHPYNHTWENERAVEIPVMLKYLKGCKSVNILERGNVLSHYIKPQHKIIDKYEKASRWVSNMDILDYPGGQTFDLILSISTLEHIGWDETPKDPQKAAAALAKIRQLLSPSGLAILTVPVGYNPFLDQYILEHHAAFSATMAMRRVSANNRWEETTLNEALQAKFDTPYPMANALLFVFISQAVRL